MCGLFASIGFDPDPARIDIVAHRGPDGRGWAQFASAAGPVALGHRRLAIIDISEAGHQPMADPSGRCHLVFNGEIYNFIELRDELAALGEVFTTASDSEVLLRAYMVWGERCLPRLRGMFAFAIWDEHSKQLFVARDRFGIKPLYIAGASPQGGRGIAFASEIKQLVGLPGLSGRMNLARVHDFLASGMSDHTAETMFDGVIQLRAGEFCVVETMQGRPAPDVKRWYPVEAGSLSLTEGEAAERYRALLTDAVRLHLRSDVPVGSCLSGGLDSSSIVCLMSNLLGSTAGGEKVHTISACYTEKNVDERPFVEDVVAHAGTEPHFIYPDAADVFDRMGTITWHQDEPFGSTSIFAQYCVFKAAREAGIKVMLDGQGADEQLAGYHGAFPYHVAGLVRAARFGEAFRSIIERRNFHGVPISHQAFGALVALLPRGLVDQLRQQHRRVVEHDWLGSEFLRRLGNQRSALSTARESLSLPPVKDVASLCLVQTFASNLQMLLHWEDRNSMAHSIEARVPFLDHPLVEFSLALGNSHKIVGADTKRVLRKGMTGILPDRIVFRRDKLGFATPEQAWFRGPLRPLIEEGITQTLARYPELFNAKGVRALADDMLSGRRALDFTLWRIVNLGIWGGRFNATI